MSKLSIRDITVDEIEMLNLSGVSFFDIIEKINDYPDKDINILIKEVQSE